MKEKIKQYEVLLILTIAAALGAGVGTFSKIGLQSLTPISFTFLRFVFAVAILAPLVIFREKKIKFIKLNYLIFVSLLATANVVLFIFGIKYTTATISQTLYAAVPLISAIFTFLIMKERLGTRKEIGLLIGFLGVVTIIFLPNIGKASPFNGTILGNLLILLAVTSVSLYFVLSKNLQKDYSPIFLTASVAVTTLFVQLFLLFLQPENLTSLMNTTMTGWLSVLYSGVLGTGIYYALYQYAIKKASPMIASMTFYIQPVFGFLWAAVLLGERITAGFLVGASLALLGVYLVTNSK